MTFELFGFARPRRDLGVFSCLFVERRPVPAVSRCAFLSVGAVIVRLCRFRVRIVLDRASGGYEYDTYKLDGMLGGFLFKHAAWALAVARWPPCPYSPSPCALALLSLESRHVSLSPYDFRCTRDMVRNRLSLKPGEYSAQAGLAGTHAQTGSCSSAAGGGRATRYHMHTTPAGQAVRHETVLYNPYQIS